MRLAELEPEFVKDGWAKGYCRTDSFDEAQGILFLCPHCFAQNNGPIGTHSILVWFANRDVPADCEPKHRWTASGTGYDDLTLSPSINLQVNGQADEWHGFITNGAIT